MAQQHTALFMIGALFVDMHLYYEVRVALVNQNGVSDFLFWLVCLVLGEVGCRSAPRFL